MMSIYPRAVNCEAGRQLTSQTSVLKGISFLTVTALEKRHKKQTNKSVCQDFNNGDDADSFDCYLNNRDKITV